MAPVTLPSELAVRLHREAEASRFAIPVERFAAALAISIEKGLADRAALPRDVEAFASGLHLRDLALAVACLDGCDEAWEQMVRDFRPALRRAAGALRPGRGEELADAIWAELFGVSASGREKTSLLRYFHGRSSLATWLRAVLAQRHVDTIRAERRLEPLPADLPDDPAARPLAEPDPPTANSRSARSLDPGASTLSGVSAERLRWMSAVHRALVVALAGLAARDRLRLSLYYAEGLTLAEIGRGLGEHEATVSRHLTRTRKVLREAAERHLAEAESMSQAEIRECLASVAADAGTLDLAALINAPPAHEKR